MRGSAVRPGRWWAWEVHRSRWESIMDMIRVALSKQETAEHEHPGPASLRAQD
jgi:hypothetical protein